MSVQPNTNSMNRQHRKLNIGDSVIVKPGTKDPDTGGDFGGWQGRISMIEAMEDHCLVEIKWDSLTLKKHAAFDDQALRKRGNSLADYESL